MCRCSFQHVTCKRHYEMRFDLDMFAFCVARFYSREKRVHLTNMGFRTKIAARNVHFSYQFQRAMQLRRMQWKQ